MDNSGGPQIHKGNESTKRNPRQQRLWQLGLTNPMSPSMMSSTSPSLQGTSAFAPAEWDRKVSPSSSGPQNQENRPTNGREQNRAETGPSSAATRVRTTESDHYGSPNRYVGKSPNPRLGPPPYSAASAVGFPRGGIHEMAYGIEEGPLSAPPQAGPSVSSKGKVVQREEDKNLFDNRWLQDSESMYVADSRRASILTVSPDETSPRRRSSYPQEPGCQTNGDRYRAAIVEDVGDSNLLPYATVMAYWQQSEEEKAQHPVHEIDRLLPLVLRLRGGEDHLASIRPDQADHIRQYMWATVFGATDGSSALSRESPELRIEVAGQQLTRQDLHNQIQYFLEMSLKSMIVHDHPVQQPSEPTAVADMRSSNAQWRLNGDSQTFNTRNNEQPHERSTSNDVRNAHATMPHDNQAPSQRGLGVNSQPIPHSDQTNEQHHMRGPPLAHDSALNNGGPSFTQQFGDPGDGTFPHPAGTAPSVVGRPAPVAYLENRPPTVVNADGRPALAPPFMMPGDMIETHYQNVGGMPATPSQQHYLSMMGHQHHFNQGLTYRPGLWPGPMYANPAVPAVTFYPGRHGTSQAAPNMFPYGSVVVPGRMGQPSLYPGQYAMHPGYIGMGAHYATGLLQHQMNPLVMQAKPHWPQNPAPRTYVGPARTVTPVNKNVEWSNRSGSSRGPSLDVSELPYRIGSDTMYPYAQKDAASVRLQELIRNGQPSYSVATSLDVIPFAENARLSRPAEWGVLRIGNIPYSLTKQEVLGFLGKNAKIVTSNLGVPIHIIMDRLTGKTMDCYVEFFSYGDAQAALNKCLVRGSQLRLGDRVVDVSLSSQDELLRELFPRAKNCMWQNGRPKILESNEPYNTGFKTFITNEELLQLVSHAEKPHRSNYTQKCLQRPYECMVSTLAKFPWFAVDRYTITTRDELFKHTHTLISLLMAQLNRSGEAWIPNISESLVTELLLAGLNAPGFSEQQRWQLCEAAERVSDKIRLSPLASVWPFEVLGRKAGADEDVVEYYAALLKQHPSNAQTASPFGSWTTPSNQALGLTTIGDIGANEWNMVKTMLQAVLSP